MAFLFGGARPSGASSLKDYVRRVRAQSRAMEREIARIDQQDERMQRELAKCGREGRLEHATGKAKELVRLRAHRSRLYTMSGHMAGLAQQLQSVQSSSGIQETLAETARMLIGLNARFDAASVTRMLAEFERQNALLQNKQEVVESTLDSAFEAEGEQDATGEAVLAVLQEAGLELAAKLGPVHASEASPAADADLVARLDRLRVP